MDHVDKIIKQWNQERPDLNVGPMATIGRVKRLSIFFTREMERTFAEFDLHSASFDVLATLLRSGKPYCMSPGELIASTMVTSGTMTNRVDQLEKAGLVVRVQSEQDKRSMKISLSDKGYTLINKVVEQHVKTQDQLTQMLSQKEKQTLDSLLQKITPYFENTDNQ
ncbi:MAG: MarR family winged helix-turn-helix transcriptional regulator [Cellvibrionaceae bacterium]